MAAARLKRAAPNAWTDFEQRFRDLCDEATARCVHSEPDKILGNQGRAQLMGELRDMLRDCVVTAEELTAKLKERK